MFSQLISSGIRIQLSAFQVIYSKSSRLLNSFQHISHNLYEQGVCSMSLDICDLRNTVLCPLPDGIYLLKLIIAE